MPRRRHRESLLAALWAAATCSPAVPAQDWPTYRHDAARSGSTEAELSLPLRELWSWRSPHPPRPAWPGPARRDAYNKVENLASRLDFDRAFQVVVAGDRVYFGSSADDQVRCLDARTGELLWTAFTEAPVRFAPTVHDGRVFLGSDDGHTYCLDAATGAERWRYRAAPRSVRIPGNGRLMSPWPVRTGVVVRDATAYFCAGLFPSEGSWLCAVQAATGAPVYKVPLGTTHPQGYLLASSSNLYVPTGRGRPAVHTRASGAKVRDLGGAGGTFALLVGDSLIYGPGKTGQLSEFGGGARPGDQLATFQGLHMLVAGDHSWLHDGRELSALHRSRFLALVAEQRQLRARSKSLGQRLAAKGTQALPAAGRRAAQQEVESIGARLTALRDALAACVLWRTPCALRDELIRCKDLLVVGGRDTVAIHRTTDGERVWTGAVAGRAHGLAAAGGRLLVSTDRGVIHCFGGEPR